MIDHTKTKIKAGNGGKGIISFRREKYVPKGGPDGGDGGKGGNVYLIASNEIATLLDFQYHNQFEAQNGESGGPSHKKGKDGEDLYIKVPVGSIIKINKLIVDLPLGLKRKQRDNEPIEYRQKMFNYKKMEKMKLREMEQSAASDENMDNPTAHLDVATEADTDMPGHHVQYHQDDMSKPYQNDTEDDVNIDAEKDRETLNEVGLIKHKLYKFSEQIQESERPIHTQRQQLISLQTPVFDLDEVGKKVCIARGGKGGKGNARFKGSEHQSPQIAEPGQQGEYVEVEITVKSVARVGLIGFPNAGKSTLLSKLTAASPKIADYPFTTLEPNLGVMILSDELRKHVINNKIIKKETLADSSEILPITQKIIIADIPGLIEGASQGKGLGFKFLQHIERTQILLHVIEYPDDTQSSEPKDIATYINAMYHTVRDELIQYGNTIPDKKEIIVINKIDRVPEDKRGEIIPVIEETLNQHSRPIAFVSAQSEAGINGLKILILKELFG